MTDLRVGHDYHLAEVHRTLSFKSGMRFYFAACDACGWTGQQRNTKSAADDDAATHDRTENE